MCESVANLLIGLGGILVAFVTLMQSIGVFLLNGDKELQIIKSLMQEGKTQSEAEKIVRDRNNRIKEIYTGLIFIGAIAMAVGGLYK